MNNEPDGIFKIMWVIGSFYSEGLDEHPMVFALLVTIIFDILLGVSCAWSTHTFSSSKFRRGLVGHAAMFFLVAMAYPFAIFMNLDGVVDSFIVAMLAAYGSSILANLSIVGVRIPKLDAIIRERIDGDKFELESQAKSKKEKEHEH